MTVEVPKYVTAIGFVAATLTTSAFVPQLLRTWRLRRAGDVSGVMLTVFSFGVLLWLIYGLLLPSFPVTIANAVTLALTLGILLLKFLYRERR